jgi:putative transposase
MSDTAMVPRKSGGDPSACRPVVDGEQADQLGGKAQAEGVELLGPDGLLSQVTKAVLERALVEEVTGGPGYEKHDPSGKATTITVVARPKTVLTHIGTVDLACPATATAPSNAFS